MTDLYTGKEMEPHIDFQILINGIERLRTSPQYGKPLTLIDAKSVSDIVEEVKTQFFQGITIRELNYMVVSTLVTHISKNPTYGFLATRILLKDLYKRAPISLLATINSIIDAAPDNNSVRISKELIKIVKRATTQIDNHIDHSRDSLFQYFGYTTMARSYLLKPTTRSSESTLFSNQIMERPQHLYMRIALSIFVCQPDKLGYQASEEIFEERLLNAFRFYDELSLHRTSNATPTILNAGTVVSQLSSCFLLASGDDLNSIFDTVKAAAMISKWSGGVSMWLHNIRANNSLIRKTGGRCSGIKRLLKILNEVQMYVDQGGNRPGAFAAYLSVDHDDIFTFLAMGRLKGEETLKSVHAPDIKYAIWVSDLFMQTLKNQIQNVTRVAEGGINDPTAGDWYLFSPDEAPGLHLVYGDEYETLYKRYISEGRARRCVKAGDIIMAAFMTWIQIGNPYVLYKDAINKKSNMKNVAPICSSNLCCEITIPSWSKHDAKDFSKYHADNDNGGEYGVCTLAAICLGSFVDMKDKKIDFLGISNATRLQVNVLNNVIDRNYYPSEECKKSSSRHRPIGIGIMGLADVLAILDVIYESPAARSIARAISAVIYYSAVSESAIIASRDGPYNSFKGSPMESGILQPDMWAGKIQSDWETDVEIWSHGFLTPSHWTALRTAVKSGIRNAYVTAYMPTATSSNMVGQNECFEAFTSNIYTRKTLAGDFMIVNSHLIRRLTELNIWDEKMRIDIINANGSVQNIERIPANIKRLSRTVREMHQSYIIEMVKAISPFICQSISMNLYLETPSLPKILRFLFEGWEGGLKIGMYYLHVTPAVGAQKKCIEVAPDNIIDVTGETACDINCTSCSV